MKLNLPNKNRKDFCKMRAHTGTVDANRMRARLAAVGDIVVNQALTQIPDGVVTHE
ncbi:hypothetical protein DPMN_145984 [Dreissena polymorpha]|uniref:Uncharacterized protein n=1 Tax=Dreissena polymorpha TaxID=45954 RepID=A0A9D4J1W2_DREPO|nr:hypothetical protein DPMN_145984 [Dreissena polymorpha]